MGLKNESQQPRPWCGLSGDEREFPLEWKDPFVLLHHVQLHHGLCFSVSGAMGSLCQAPGQSQGHGAQLSFVLSASGFFLFFLLCRAGIFSWTETSTSLTQGGVGVCILYDGLCK